MAQFRYNTLTFVNKILNALDLQPVSTLGETEDAEMVLELVERAYVELDLTLNWFPRKTVVRLSSSTGTGYTHATDNWLDTYPAIPWAMKLPDGVEEVISVYYNGDKMRYISPNEMLYRIEKTTANKTTDDPKYWTSGMLDEDYIYFDSVDISTEVALVSSKAEAYVTQVDTTIAIASDSDTLNFTEKAIDTLTKKCIAYGFYELVGNTSLGDRYERMATSAKNKLIRQSRKTRPNKVHPNNIDFGYKKNRSTVGPRTLDPSEYTEV